MHDSPKVGAVAAILVAEDDENFRTVCTVMLRKGGYDVLSVRNGDEAVKALGEKRFQALLLDIHMPGRSGWDVLRYAVANTPPGSPPPCALMMTGLTTEMDLDRLRREGASGMLIKPFGSDALLAEIERLLATQRSGGS